MQLVFTPATGSAVTFDDDVTNGSALGILSGVDGTGVPAPVLQVVNTPSRDGGLYVANVSDERYLTVRSTVQGTSQSNLYSKRQTLITAVNPQLGLGSITYTPVTGGTAYTIPAILSDALGLDGQQLIAPLAIAPSLTFRCPDPFWRSTTASTQPFSATTTGATIAVTNSGTASVYPSVSAPGPFTGLTVQNLTTGKTMSLPNVVIASGHTLVIDFDAGTATDNGTSVISARSASSVRWQLLTGTNSVKISTTSGTCTATLSWTRRWAGI